MPFKRYLTCLAPLLYIVECQHGEPELLVAIDTYAMKNIFNNTGEGVTAASLGLKARFQSAKDVAFYRGTAVVEFLPNGKPVWILFPDFRNESYDEDLTMKEATTALTMRFSEIYGSKGFVKTVSIGEDEQMTELVTKMIKGRNFYEAVV